MDQPPTLTEVVEVADVDSRSLTQHYLHPKRWVYRVPQRRLQPPFSFSSGLYSVQIPALVLAAEDLAGRRWRRQQLRRAADGEGGTSSSVEDIECTASRRGADRDLDASNTRTEVSQ